LTCPTISFSFGVGNVFPACRGHPEMTSAALSIPGTAGARSPAVRRFPSSFPQSSSGQSALPAACPHAARGRPPILAGVPVRAGPRFPSGPKIHPPARKHPTRWPGRNARPTAAWGHAAYRRGWLIEGAEGGGDAAWGHAAYRECWLVEGARGGGGAARGGAGCRRGGTAGAEPTPARAGEQPRPPPQSSPHPLPSTPAAGLRPGTPPRTGTGIANKKPVQCGSTSTPNLASTPARKDKICAKK